MPVLRGALRVVLIWMLSGLAAPYVRGSFERLARLAPHGSLLEATLLKLRTNYSAMVVTVRAELLTTLTIESIDFLFMLAAALRDEASPDPSDSKALRIISAFGRGVPQEECGPTYDGAVARGAMLYFRRDSGLAVAGPASVLRTSKVTAVTDARQSARSGDSERGAVHSVWRSVPARVVRGTLPVVATRANVTAGREYIGLFLHQVATTATLASVAQTIALHPAY